ncbi:hypothetical protein Nwat_0149 [Nitrosococcus watsonii C-113]|uniref:Uncharacterized protein n=1 Tax=Nitrosococcus watsoni (strain C-113) TaxID=105559 RepID=D8K8R5_NITWC|nr:hypothetical protein Nwat_0149 [Nitrosococcus watsonii C-113]
MKKRITLKRLKQSFSLGRRSLFQLSYYKRLLLARLIGSLLLFYARIITIPISLL